MQYSEWSRLLNADKKGMCHCPCHPDQKRSLKLSDGKDRVLMKCFAGCSTESVVKAVGKKMSDLYYENRVQSDPERWIQYVESREHKQIQAIYHHIDIDGNYACTKIRLKPKDFRYGVLENGRFKYGLGGKSRKSIKAFYCKDLTRLKEAAASGQTVYIAEGEKDIDNLYSCGLMGLTCGGVNDWCKGVTDILQGAAVVVFADNDQPGITVARQIEKDLQGIAKSVKVVIPTPDKEHGDISDFLAEHTVEELKDLISKPDKKFPVSILKSFNDIEEKEAEWLIHGLIPKGQINTVAGDGGVGKTSMWCSIVAAVSSGNNCLLDIPFWERQAGNVLIFSGEDSAEFVLKRRLRKHGANLNNVYTVSISDENFDQIKFDSPLLESMIEQVKPVLVVFDPLQAFVAPNIRMGDRNAMRQSLIPIAGLGEKYGTTFLIILHSNKQSGVWGRKRMADSSDVWDISRSVLMVGSTQQEGVNYISQEKSNYGKLSETHLFSIENEVVKDRGTTGKRDRDFVLEELHEQKRQAPAKDNARDAVLEFLGDGQPHFAKELDEYCTAASITKTSLRRAKEELKAEGLIQYLRGGGRSGGGWRVQKVNK